MQWGQVALFGSADGLLGQVIAQYLTRIDGLHSLLALGGVASLPIQTQQVVA